MGHSQEDILIKKLLINTYGELLAVQSDRDGWIEKDRIGDLISEEEIMANYDIARKAYYDLNPKVKDSYSIAIRHKSLRGLENNCGWIVLIDNSLSLTMEKKGNCPKVIEVLTEKDDVRTIVVMTFDDLFNGYFSNNQPSDFFGVATHYRIYNNNLPLY